MVKRKKRVIDLRYIILLIQIIILMSSPLLETEITAILIGITVIIMGFNSYKKFGNNILTWIYVIAGISLITIGIFDLNGYNLL